MGEKRYVRSIRWQMTAGVLALSLGSALGVGSLAWAQGPLDEDGEAEGGFSSLERDAGESVCQPCGSAASCTGKVLAAGAKEAARARRSLTAAAAAFKQRAEDDAGESACDGPHDEAGTAASGEDEEPGSATDARTDGAEAGKSKTGGTDQGAPWAAGPSGTSNASRTAEKAASDSASAEPREAPNPESPASCPEKADAPQEAPPAHTHSPAPNDGEHTGKTPCTLTIGETTIPYCDVRGGTTPSTGGGLWRGSDAVDDGSWGYFVGHNPGSFAPVRLLGPGDAVTVCDSTGTERTYTVRDVFTAEADATWKTIADRVTRSGESIALQTCNDEGGTVTIVVAA